MEIELMKLGYCLKVGCRVALGCSLLYYRDGDLPFRLPNSAEDQIPITCPSTASSDATCYSVRSS